ncbi:MAG: SDR family oxidoreductase [Paludibacteraceae bacterium]|nr:SDR family oxidoreductase [Paludibacteraceae bacterium]
MVEILEGKRGLIFGALDERSLAWHVAERCMSEGARIVLTNTSTAIKLGTISELSASRGVELIACDATNPADIESLFSRAQEILGGKIDFLLHAVAQSTNLRRHKSYEQANYTYFQQTIDVSALSLHKILRTAMEQDAISEGGSVVALSYIASERYLCGYNDMADAKAMLESIARQMGALYGRKRGVRVNIVSQSPTPTKAGGGWEKIDYFYRYANHLSPLGNADADDCAGTCVALFSDLMRKVTMQTIYSDGGFGRTMLTPEVMEDIRDIKE